MPSSPLARCPGETVADDASEPREAHGGSDDDQRGDDAQRHDDRADSTRCSAVNDGSVADHFRPGGRYLLADLDPTAEAEQMDARAERDRHAHDGDDLQEAQTVVAGAS